MKAKKCSYRYCENPENFNPEEAVYDNGKYFHLKCYEKKQAKQQVFSMFCGYVTNNENGLFIRKKISDFIDKESFSPVYTVFAMQYIINNKIPLKSIFGLKIVMQQKRVKNAYQKYIEQYQTPHVDVQTKAFEFQRDNKGGWRDLIG